MSATKTSATKPSTPQTFYFSDDGVIPNNPDLPFVVYRGAINLAGTADPEIVVERTFATAGWGEM